MKKKKFKKNYLAHRLRVFLCHSYGIVYYFQFVYIFKGAFLGDRIERCTERCGKMLALKDIFTDERC